MVGWEGSFSALAPGDAGLSCSLGQVTAVHEPPPLQGNCWAKMNTGMVIPLTGCLGLFPVQNIAG